MRIEHADAGRVQYVGLTVCTPVDETTTRVHHAMYWNRRWLDVAKPLARRVARMFLGQDRDAVAKQQDGLRFDPSLMLIDDADRMAKWYFRLKREYQESRREGRDFANPIKPTTLRWRS